MANPIIKFKGVHEGLLITIEGSDIELIKEELDKKISETSKFYQGIRFLGVESKSLTQEEILDLNLLLRYKYELDISLKDIFKDVFHHSEEKTYKKDEKDSENFINEMQEEMTKFIYGTLRSGQEVAYEGHVVVVGDVNPGAVIKANGNVVILGNLRGIVYAGLGGDRSSIIAAYKLLASQLRICDVIGRAPDETEFHYKVPEIVRLKDGKLEIEPYLPNR
nr:septum site-determining protein MinC [Tissierella sp.]